jgi:hypothetical protein
MLLRVYKDVCATMVYVGVTQGLHGGDHPPRCTRGAFPPHAPAKGLGHSTHCRDAQFPVRRCPLSRCVPSCYSSQIVIINVGVGPGPAGGGLTSMFRCNLCLLMQVGCTHGPDRIRRASTRHIVTCPFRCVHSEAILP